MKTALDKFEAGRRVLRKAYFGNRDFGGLTYEWGHEWVLRNEMGLPYSTYRGSPTPSVSSDRE